MIEVVAGIIVDREHVLIAQRLSKDQMGPKWDFPGGKIDKVESPKDCLKRELLEEFGVTVKVGDFFVKTQHDYEDFSIELNVYW